MTYPHLYPLRVHSVSSPLNFSFPFFLSFFLPPSLSPSCPNFRTQLMCGLQCASSSCYWIADGGALCRWKLFPNKENRKRDYGWYSGCYYFHSGGFLSVFSCQPEDILYTDFCSFLSWFITGRWHSVGLSLFMKLLKWWNKQSTFAEGQRWAAMNSDENRRTILTDDDDCTFPQKKHHSVWFWIFFRFRQEMEAHVKYLCFL